MIISVVSGGFDPLHSGHLSYINAASKEGSMLIVLLNSDSWLIAKKGKAFMPFEERKEILLAIKNVDQVIPCEDSDGSCVKSLQKLINDYPNAKIIFCNGGDRTKKNIPELSVKGVEFKFGIGGNNKKNSSSSILASWRANFEERSWGSFHTFHTRDNLKIKQLIISPKQGISFQQHNHRTEIWYVQEGSCVVFLQNENQEDFSKLLLHKGDVLKVPIKTKHQLINVKHDPCTIIEIQSGDQVNELDIERFFYYPKTPQKV